MSLLFQEIWISPKLEVCGEKEVDIRNQRPRLRRNSLFLVEKAGGGCKGVPFDLTYTKLGRRGVQHWEEMSKIVNQQRIKIEEYYQKKLKQVDLQKKMLEFFIFSDS